MGNIIFERNELLINSVIKNLEKRNFNAYYCSSKDEVLKEITNLIGKNEVIAWGGSVTLDELRIKQYLEDSGYKTINRDKAKNREEKAELIMQGFSSDVYLMSSNAISEDGILVNIDGTGNRTAALCYGPKRVIVIAGVNKITKTLDDAISRARNTAAPVNAKRVSAFMEVNTPCLKNGSCMNCKSETSICTQVVITRLSNPKGRINVILVNDKLGY